MKYFHAMVRVRNLDASLAYFRNALLQKGVPLPPAEPWKSMRNTGKW